MKGARATSHDVTRGVPPRKMQRVDEAILGRSDVRFKRHVSLVLYYCPPFLFDRRAQSCCEFTSFTSSASVRLPGAFFLILSSSCNLAFCFAPRLPLGRPLPLRGYSPED